MKIPNPHLNRQKEISYEKRDSLLHFNTAKYWHCFYDSETKILYNEYCIRIMDDAYSYLVSLGLLDKDGKTQIKYFEDEA